MRANFSRFARVDSRRVYLLLIITSYAPLLERNFICITK